MMDSRLQRQFAELDWSVRKARLGKKLLACWLITLTVVVGLLLLDHFSVVAVRSACWPVLGIGVAAALFLRWQERRRPDDFIVLAKQIGQAEASAGHLLTTALEQQPDSLTGEFGFLQRRVIDEALRHPRWLEWRRELARRAAVIRNFQLLALAGLLLVVMVGNLEAPGRKTSRRLPVPEITVSPGDVEIERGSGLIISARFNMPPAEATLVMKDPAGKTSRLPLARNLADPVFGGSLLAVADNLSYHVEYGGRQSPEFKVRVFDFPALQHADATLSFPAYTGLTNQTIPDTRRITAVEGSWLDYELTLNKPVNRARLIGQGFVLPLATGTNATASLHQLQLTNSTRLRLELVDAEGRTNKAPAEFVLQVLPNRPPELKLVSPHGDQRVSPLQEITLQGEVRDDFGVIKYGLGFGVAGDEPRLFEIGHGLAAVVKTNFEHQVDLEPLHLATDQLLSYFAWAEDFAPDGSPRRTFTDIFFAEVRPFEEIFRADQSGGGGQNQGQGGQSGQGGAGGNQGPRLAELQKQIVIATWKLRRDKIGMKEITP
ncbi:MAG: DUF4175 family protein [Verrucomicrobiota bacterium]